MKERLTLEVGLSTEVEKAFAPGNLVIGVVRKISPELFSKGITTSNNTANTTLSNPNIIRAAMLDNGSMPNRYLDLEHRGPKGYEHLSELEKEVGVPWKIAFIVSLPEILAEFPGQVHAVGRKFKGDSRWRGLLNQWLLGFSPFGQLINGIPIVRIDGRTYGREVRIHPNDPENACITPDMWTGVVTNSPQGLMSFLEEHNLTLGVPAFDQDGLDTAMHLSKSG